MGLKIAAAIGAVGFAGILAGCSGGGDSNASSGTPALSSQTASSGGAGGAGGMGSGGSGGGSGGMGSGGGQMSMKGGGMMGGGGQAAPAAAVAKNVGGAPPAGHRLDPFKPWWAPAPPPSVLTFTSPVRIAMANSSDPGVQPNIEVHEVPTRRVAGILSGNGVYALIEGNGEMVVVKPGDPVGDYRVDSINSDSVVLKKVVKFGKNTQIYTQVVPLTDVGSSVAQFSGPIGGAGRPMPGAGRGGPGLSGPGGMRGGIGGKGGGVGGLD